MAPSLIHVFIFSFIFIRFIARISSLWVLLMNPLFPKYLSFHRLGFLWSALFPLPAIPNPPLFPEPLLFFFEPQPKVCEPFCLEFFFLLLTVILVDHPCYKFIDFFSSVAHGPSFFEGSFKPFSPKSFLW